VFHGKKKRMIRSKDHVIPAKWLFTNVSTGTPAFHFASSLPWSNPQSNCPITTAWTRMQVLTSAGTAVVIRMTPPHLRKNPDLLRARFYAPGMLLGSFAISDQEPISRNPSHVVDLLLTDVEL